MSRSIAIDSGAAMQALGAELAAVVRAGDVVLLHGDLGAGKTTLAQGFAASLGVRGTVQSPTFTFVATHAATTSDGRGIERVHHIDLYRLEDASELAGIGWESYLEDSAAVTVVEWPERAGDAVPGEAWVVEIGYAGPDRRIARLESWPPGAHDREIASIAGRFSAAD